jgi:hypothetical protein
VWQLTNILEHPEEFRKVLTRAVLGGKNLEMSAVVLLDAPRDAQHLQVSQWLDKRLIVVTGRGNLGAAGR